LLALRDQGNDQIWTDFCTRYQPLLLSFARKLGLTEHDAQDAAQEALLAFAEAYREGKYDRDKGRLRKWLLGIAAFKIRDVQRRHGREIALAETDDKTGLIGGLPDEHSMGQLWEAEWHRAIIGQCMDQVRGQFEPATLEAFELFVLQEWPAEKVASHLNISANAVFKAKRRVLSRIREAYSYLQENW